MGNEPLWNRRRLGAFLMAAVLSIAASTRANAQNADDVKTLNAQVTELYGQGNYTEAASLLERILTVLQTKLGPEHPDVAQSLNNLAEIYRAQGRYAEAEPLYKRSLAIDEKALGADHSAVGTTLNNLALQFDAQGRYSEAELLFNRSLSIRESVLGPDHPEVGTSLSNLGLLYLHQGRFSDAELVFKRSLAVLERALGRDHPRIGPTLNNLAGLYASLGRYAEAEPLQMRDLAISEMALGPNHPDVAHSLYSLADLYANQARTADAELLHLRGLSVREKTLGPDHPDVAQSLNALAGLYSSLGLDSKAEPLYRRSITIREKSLGPEHPDFAISLGQLAAICARTNRIPEAEWLHERSMAILAKSLGPEHHLVSTSLNNLAAMYASHGRLDEGEKLLNRSLSLTEKALGSDHPSMGISLINLASIALERRDWDRAAEHWWRATSIMKRRIELGSEGSREQRVSTWYFSNLVKLNHIIASEQSGKRANLAAEMFQTAQWAQVSEAAQSLSRMAARSSNSNPALSSLMRDRQDLAAERQVKDKQLVIGRGLPRGGLNTTIVQELKYRIAAIDVRLSNIDARLAVEFPDVATFASPKPISAADVQTSLRPDEALVLFLDTPKWDPLPEETFVWIVTKTDIHWVRSELGTSALTREVAALRCGLDATAWHGNGAKRCADLLGLVPDQLQKSDASLPFDHARAYKLYTSLFSEVRDVIKGKHLLLVLSGPLTQLPFQVLVTEAPKSAEHKSIRWLAREHALTVLPAVSSLKALRRVAKPSAAEQPMIGFGNPLLDGDQSQNDHKTLAAQARAHKGCAQAVTHRTAALRGHSRSPLPMVQRSGLVELALVRQQTPLPETADELCAVARDLKVDFKEIHLGTRATEREVKRLSAATDTTRLSNYGIVHFATHGTLAGQLSGTTEPGLILTPPEQATEEDDGYLSAGEIAGLKLDADWVILSACNTAGPALGHTQGANAGGAGAEALSGLARAFFYAGARALLVSHWEVESDATVKLITAAVGAITRDKSVGRGEALRRAMLGMIEKGDPAQSHPSYWAPFIVVGEGAAGR